MRVLKSLLVLFSLFCGVLMCSGLVFAQSGVVGVSEGDWFSYGFSFEWYSDDANMTVPEEDVFDYLMEGELIMFEVSEVLGSNVTGQFEINYENGTQQIISGWVDVTTGEGEFGNWLISSGLDANDFTYQSDFGEAINETLMFSSQLGLRETNHIEYSFGNTTDDDYYYVFSVNMYWDKEVGVLVEMSFDGEMMADGNLTTAYGGWKLAESSIEHIPEFSAPVVVGSFVAATIAIFAIKKRIH
ncbi:MAG: hypothetical protein NWF06_04655 [Candidatus Bathyarchaeota archaeon]|nr:hypothetical protein [Candidatus Bathyarchaeum sp.]